MADYKCKCFYSPLETTHNVCINKITAEITSYTVIGLGFVTYANLNRHRGVYREGLPKYAVHVYECVCVCVCSDEPQSCPMESCAPGRVTLGEVVCGEVPDKV